MHNSISDRAVTLKKFSDRSWEPFKDEYLPHLRELLKVIKDIGEPLEGNIFYANLEANLTEELSANFFEKRRNLALFSLSQSSILEIGFNSGFSALLLLTANKSLRLTCVDICYHKYTIPCFNYLKTIFNDRIQLIESNSLMAFPLINTDSYVKPNAYIIDGGHGMDVAEADLLNVITYGDKGSIICFDDSDFPDLRVLLDIYLLKGKLIAINDVPKGHIQDGSQMFFINNK
jgi:hypothetical protein